MSVSSHSSAPACVYSAAGIGFRWGRGVPRVCRTVGDHKVYGNSSRSQVNRFFMQCMQLFLVIIHIIKATDIIITMLWRFSLLFSSIAMSAQELLVAAAAGNKYNCDIVFPDAYAQTRPEPTHLLNLRRNHHSGQWLFSQSCSCLCSRVICWLMINNDGR